MLQNRWNKRFKLSAKGYSPLNLSICVRSSFSEAHERIPLSRSWRRSLVTTFGLRHRDRTWHLFPTTARLISDNEGSMRGFTQNWHKQTLRSFVSGKWVEIWEGLPRNRCNGYALRGIKRASTSCLSPTVGSNVGVGNQSPTCPNQSFLSSGGLWWDLRILMSTHLVQILPSLIGRKKCVQH